jgi:hypothetical protein
LSAADAETRWIVACLRGLGHAASRAPAGLNWDRALTIAETEGVAPALGFAWKAEPPVAMPAAVRERLNRCLTESTARHLILTRELARLLDAFDRDGVSVIPLKGPALAETLYPHPAVRPCTDLDLLIHREALVGVDTLLQRLGYRRRADDHSWSFDVTFDRATLYEGPAGIHVDLHWALLSDPRFSWNEADALTVWERATKLSVGGRAALGLCPEDLLLYLAMHLAVHHGLAGLLWYWDLARLLERWEGNLDWTAVADRASRWRVRRAVYFALRGCHDLFGVSAPAAVMSRLRPRGPRASALHWLVRHCDAARLKRLEHVIALLLVDRARDVVGSVTRIVWPSQAWLQTRYASASLAACYVTHWRRVAGIARAATWAAVRGATITRRDR